MKDQHCHDCGRPWPHPLLYDVLADNTSGTIGRCSTCAFLRGRQLRLPLHQEAA